jgi:hypothetical protein
MRAFGSGAAFGSLDLGLISAVLPLRYFAIGLSLTGPDAHKALLTCAEEDSIPGKSKLELPSSPRTFQWAAGIATPDDADFFQGAIAPAAACRVPDSPACPERK